MSGTGRRGVTAALLLLALTLAAYAPVTGNGFVNFDDDEYVAANRVVARGLTAEGLRWALTTTHASNWHPLTWFSHLLDVELFGLRPGAHHAVSLVLHLVAAGLLLGALLAATGAVWRSALVAGLFALHPLHVESVAWVAERKDVLSTALWALTLALYLRYARRPGRGRYLALAGTFALALAAKPMVLTLPALLLLLDFWPLGRLAFPAAPTAAARAGLSPWRLVAEKAPLAALSAACAAAAWHAHRGGSALELGERLTLGARAANALVSYAAYLGDALWPAGLAVFYPHPETLPPWRPLAAAALLAAVTALALRRPGRRPWLPVGWLWYLGTLLPVVGLVQAGAQARADRYTYVPLVGVFLVAAWSAAATLAAGGPRLRRAAAAVAAAALLLFAAATRVQAGYWRDSCTLFARTVAVTAGNALGRNNLAECLLGRGLFVEARQHLEAALRLEPAYADAHANLGIALARLGRAADGEAHLREALRLEPGRAGDLVNLANVLVQQRRGPEAEAALREALRLDPGLPTAHANLCVLLARRGARGQAEAACREALRLDPGHPLAAENLGRLLRGGPL